MDVNRYRLHVIRTALAVCAGIATCAIPIILSLTAGVDAVTAASGVANLVRLELREPDGDVIVVQVLTPPSFYYKLYSGQLNVHNPHDALMKTELFAKTNSLGYWSIYVQKADVPQQLTIKPKRARSTGNLRADIVAVNVSGQLARIYVKGSVGSMELRGPKFGTVQVTEKIGAISVESNLTSLIVGHMNGGFISTYRGSIKTMSVASNMIDTLVWTGIDRFFGLPGLTGRRDLGSLTVNGKISGCSFYMGPASFGSDFEQPTGHLGVLRARTLKSLPGIIENTVIVSSNGVDKIVGDIGANVVINGVVTNWTKAW